MPIDQGAISFGDSGFEPETVRILGIYEHVLREWCRAEVRDYPQYVYGSLEFEGEEYRQWEAEVEAVADELFNERVGLGEPVVAWWYWLPNLPPPLDVVTDRSGGPRRARVTADDRVWLMAPGEEMRWSRSGFSGAQTGPVTQ